MEKALNEEDRIRRAEEIYYRRRNNLNATKTATVNLNPKKEYKLFKKLALQILICVLIYFAIYALNTNTDNFSVDSVSYIKNTMAYDADIEKWFNETKNYLMGIYNNENKKEQNVQEETLAVSEKNTNTVVDKQAQTEEQNVKEQSVVTEEASSISQMEEDAKYIKENFSLIKPATGTITSRFGIRNPTTATVPIYHTGIDIGVGEGTVFVASMDGVVELVSSVGDYRKSCKNIQWRCNDTLCTL